MTERGRSAIARSSNDLEIGPSRLSWDGRRLQVDIDEWTVPIPARLRGTIAIEPGPIFQEGYDLDEQGRHLWRPIAPCAHAAVFFDKPGIRWQGRAYVDMNAGSEPLEAGFRRWNWSREEAGNSTRILYDVEQRDGSRRGLALDYSADGAIAHIEPQPEQILARTGWLVGRGTRASAGQPARVLRTLEDTPFYSRSILGFGAGDTRRAVHESVDLDRFSARWVQLLLPFRMPRRAG